jgi:hypothetical protein
MEHILVLREIPAPELLQAAMRSQPGVEKTPSGIYAAVSTRDFSKGYFEQEP